MLNGMMTDWKKYKIKNAPLEIIDGDRGVNYPSQSDFFSTGYCLFLSAKNVKKTSFDFSERQFISQERDNLLRKGKLKRNDTILTTRGTVGNLAFYNDQIPYENIRINSGMVIIRPFESELIPQYCFYLFRALQQNHFEVFTSGSAQPQLPIRDLNEMEVVIPEPEEQKIIVDALSSLDDKINLLQRQNKTLEVMAETLFRQWFVEEGEESWEVGTIEDEFNFTMGQSPLGASLNDEGDGMIFFQGRTDFGFRFPEPRVFTTEPNRLAKKFDTLVSVRAPVGDMNMAIEDCCIGRGVAAFRYKVDPKFNSYTYYKMRSLMNQIKLFEDSGTVFGSIGKEDFKELKNVLHPSELIQRFQNGVSPIDKKIYQNVIQVEQLTRLRDTLLPKLMSGEVKVNF